MKNRVLQYLLIFWGLCLANNLVGQDFGGNWQGTNYSPGSATTEYWPVSLTLTQNGTNLTGTMHFSARDLPQYYVTFEVTGRVTGENSFWLDITKIVDENKEDDNNVWCVGEGNFSLDPEERKFSGVIDFSNCPFRGQTELFRLELVSENIFCKSEMAQLEVTGSNVKWYADENKTRLLNQGNRFSVQLEANTVFYVTQTHYNTESPVLPVTVSVMDVNFEALTEVACDSSTGRISLETAIQGIEFRLANGEFSANSTFQDLTLGTYRVTGRVGECLHSKNVALEEKVAPQITRIESSGVSCAGNDGSILINASTASPSLLYALGDGGFQTSNQFAGLDTGTYQVHVTDAGACIATDTVVISPSENAVRISAIEMEDPTCDFANGRISITAAGGTAPLSYSLDGLVFQTENIFDSLANNSYRIYVRDAAECRVDSDAVLQAGVPLGEIIYDRVNSNCGKADGNITIRQPSVENVTFALDQAAPTSSRAFHNLSAGNYHIIARNEQGCTSEITVEIQNNCYGHVQFPTAISPNGDAVNDSFVAFFGEEKLNIVRFSVFNRWGTLIFNKEAFELKSGEVLWDGTVDERNSDTGVYAYLLEVSLANRDTYTYNGYVQIMR